MKTHHYRVSPGFSLVEILSVISVVGIMAAIGIAAYTGAFSGVKNAKLDHDVQTMNQAVVMYLGSGGNLDGLTTPGEVLAKLKTIRSRANAKTYVGAGTGKLVDPRVVGLLQSDAEASGNTPRAVWDPTSKRFQVVYSGTGGVKDFILDDSIAESAATVENREDAGMEYKASDGWVWDGQTNWQTLAKQSPSRISTTQYPDGWVPPVVTVDPGGTGSGGGSGGGGGGGTTEPPTDPPTPDIPRLNPPTIAPGQTLLPIEQFPLEVSLGALPSQSLGVAQYRLGAGNWVNYAGPFTIPPATTVYYKSVTLDPEQALDSVTYSQTYYGTQGSFSGATDLSVEGVNGGANLEYNVSDSGDAVVLTHGNPKQDLGGEIVDSGEANTLRLSQGSFSNAALGSTFQLADMQVHNGTTFNDSHATQAQVSMVFTIPSLGVNQTVTMQLRFVNTENSEDRAASADYVVFLDMPKTIPFSGNDGTSYQLHLNLQSTNTSNGYISGVNEFHVYEGATALGAVMGTITN